MDNERIIDRRTLVASGLLAAGGLSTAASADGGLRDFSFQDGSWTVRHRKLRKRLAGNNEWVSFGGTCTAGPLMAGKAGYEDNFLDEPTRPYRAAGLRRFDPRTGLWSIWWWDERYPDNGPPVIGRFADGVGIFLGDDELNGRPIKVRYTWDLARPGVPRWQQAFSADGGASWETNWYMEFLR